MSRKKQRRGHENSSAVVVAIGRRLEQLEVENRLPSNPELKAISGTVFGIIYCGDAKTLAVIEPAFKSLLRHYERYGEAKTYPKDLHAHYLGVLAQLDLLLWAISCATCLARNRTPEDKSRLQAKTYEQLKGLPL